MIQKYLKTFQPLLNLLAGDNVALAGSISLRLHGLIVNREPGDMDIVIFSPTAAQLKVLADLSWLRIEGNKDSEYTSDNVIHCKSLKFKKDDLVADVLLEPKKSMPPDLLIYEFEGKYYRIQSIKNTIDAKRSFRHNRDSSIYIREKDVMDFEMLKRDNFNLIQ